MCTNFQLKTTTLPFLAWICPITKIGFEFQETSVRKRISILEIPCVLIFRQNEQLWVFGPKFAKNWILGSKFQKSKSRFRMSILEILCAPIFSQNGQLLLFWAKFLKLANYVQYFGSNIVESVAESWLETEMSWVQVDGAGWRLKIAEWRWT